MDVERKVINGIRNLSLDMINKAGSGHPGICLDMAPTIYTLFNYFLKFNPSDGSWINRDRFVMSAGHGSALLYSTLFFAGYPIKFEELKDFRQAGARLTGHPEYNPLIGIETTTGPLGQGIATATGMAIGEEYLRNTVGNNIFDYYTYVLVGDGDLMEGMSHESISLAGSLKLNKLIVLYDSNRVSLDGSTSNVFDENILETFRACGWNTLEVMNGEDVNSIKDAISKSKLSVDKPTIIKINTILGIGSIKQGTNEVHGKPLSEEDLLQVKEKMNVRDVPFYISNEAASTFRSNISNRNMPLYNDWKNNFNKFLEEDSVNKKIVNLIRSGNFNINLNNIKVNFEKGQTEELRVTNGKLMNLISNLLPTFIGGSADLASSTKTYITHGNDFKINSNKGKNIHFGVREGSMAAILNGLALSGLRPFGSSFLTFSDYMKPGMRLTSLMNLPVTYIFTHDSISIGEDGPTHQPIEQLGMLRSIPNMKVFRPCDVKELVGAWNFILNNKCPSTLVITKEKLPEIISSDINLVEKGAYTIKNEGGRLSAVLVSSGSDLLRTLEVSQMLERDGIFTRVVSAPSLELFDNQSQEYKDSLFPVGIKVIAIEASNDANWNKYVYNSKYLITLNNFGISGKGQDVLKYFNFDIESLYIRIKELIK